MHDVHAEGFGFPEGPVAMPDGSIVFVDLLHQNVRRFKDGRIEVLGTIAGSPNGMRMGPDGDLYIANNGGVAPKSLHETVRMPSMVSGRIQKFSLDGTLTDVVTKLEGAGPWRPNDLVFTPDQSRIVFTDPQNWEEVQDWSVSGRIPGYGGGRLYVSEPDGSAKILAEIYGFPNGLVFHPDGSLLVGITLQHRIVRLPWMGDRVGEPELWCQFDGGTAPDGIILSGELIYVAGSVGDHIAVVDLDGKLVKTIDTGAGSDPTNLCVMGDRLWVTLGLRGQLISMPL